MSLLDINNAVDAASNKCSNLIYFFFCPQLQSYNRHSLVADPFEDGFKELMIKRRRMKDLEKKVKL